MNCKIAGLIVKVPEAGDLVSRCREYLCDPVQGTKGADIIIRTERFRRERQGSMDEAVFAYIETGMQFSTDCLNFGAVILHSSAVEKDGKAYLFSAPCGTGKSTHSKLWQKVFGERAKVFNDDKPVLRKIDGIWYAYGTPWCGKDGININMKAPVAGICFLKQAQENKIRRLSNREAVQKMIWQTAHNYANAERMDMRLELIDSIVRNIPIYELENKPVPEAAKLSYETMRRGAEELGL